MGDVKFFWCNVCKKEIDTPIRKPMDTMEKIIWIIFIAATVGIGLIPFLIYRYKIRPKNYCPTCETKLKISDHPFIEPEEELEAKTPKERVLKKVGKTKEIHKRREEQKEKKQKIDEKKNEEIKEEVRSKLSKCPYCGNKIEPDVEDSLFCQFCGAKL
jgi:hypothetical protein